MEKHHIPKVIADRLDSLLGWTTAVLLFSITLATLGLIAEEFWSIWERKDISLSDILLLFIYLEALAMVHQYISFGKLPVRYPIYIAIIAIARHIILGMKEMNDAHMITLSVAVLILTISTTIMRVGHHYWPYKKMPGER
ncbi:Protein PsiE [BD1-7 clade bacterium]|uniref:Protein PsiE n=1 Tax=BD1-7 clade bacterium TaxID=2029982 RepID=A0A5S9QC27_9GAMM|nr:Protein PsiE [BD1-7 clade bacterium]CAA0115292.1 Protein PsiE [BD1-7 clade bacterium]CAA0118998.1 Protein PsiE [BD1-7 clade bacterium]